LEEGVDYTALDRFKDALKGRPKDRVPVLGGTSLWAAANYPEASYKEIASDPDLIVKSQLWAHDLIGIDAFYAAPDALFIAEAFGCRIRFSETGPLVDPLPLSFDRQNDVQKVDFPNPRASGRFPVVLEAARLLSQEANGEIPLVGTFEGAFTNTCRIIEVEQILRMTHKNPWLLDELLDRMNRFLIDFAMAFVENGVNILFIPEPTASSTMISPKMFRRFALPRLQSFTKQLDVPIVLHICGDTKPILESMEESGADILSLDQCMDLAESRAAVPAVGLGGNVDPVGSLLMGDAACVEKDAVNCLRKAGTDRFILMPGCGIPPNAPKENLKTMVKVAEDFGL
jgi:MtaA/CmuA family methyltransferase